MWEGFGVGVEIRPTYAAAFRCVGPECEDSCCGNWDIPLDRATYAIYQSFPQEKLGDVVQRFVSRVGGNAPESFFAQIEREPSGCCPFFGGDRLCGIQKEYGAGMLSATCSIYPRSLSQVQGRLEGSLSLSCPEAARNVLLDAGFLEREADLLAGGFRTDNVFGLAGGGCPDFYAVRESLVAMVRDRSRPVWRRLLLIGSFCRRLDEAGDCAEDGAKLLRDFAEMVGQGSGLDAEMMALPCAPGVRLEVVLELSAKRAQDAGVRFRETFWSFVEGIGSDAAAIPGEDVARFVEAAERYWKPWVEERPWAMENYLLNYMFQHLFPFGREGSDQFTRRTAFEEWVLMTTQFAWAETLLIGVAGGRREAFDEADVVRTVQSFTRAVEHYPEVLEEMMECVRARGLMSVQGMAVLLRIKAGTRD